MKALRFAIISKRELQDMLAPSMQPDIGGALAQYFATTRKLGEEPMTYQETIELKTAGHGDMHDLTSKIVEIVKRSQVRHGLVNVFCIGSTLAVGTIEFEPGLRHDLPEILDKLIPPGRHYGHEKTWHDGNAHSHLQATLLGPSLTVPISNGELQLGTWQQIICLECDIRPRQRNIMVTVLG